MDDKGLKTPFDTFDFFGYIMPGTILLMGFYVHDKVLLNGNGPCIRLWNSIFTNPSDILTAYIFPLILFIGIIIAYILGHIVSAFSSALLDRFIMGRVNTYPYVNLLRLHETDRKKYKRYCYKICLIDILFISIYVSFCKPKPIVLYVAVAVVIITLILKQMINHIWFDKEMKEGKEIEYSNIMRGWMIVFFPFNAIVWFFGKLSRVIFGPIKSLFRIGHSFTESFHKLFSDKFMNVYKVSLNGLDTNVFWLTGMYIVRNMPLNAALAQRAYNLCTLSRNLTMAVLLLFWYGVIVHYFYVDLLSYLNVQIVSVTSAQMIAEKRYYIWISIMVFLTSILWTRFYNTYYNHYTKLVLRAFVTPKEITPKES